MILPKLNRIPIGCDAKMAGLLALFTFSEQWMYAVATDTDISTPNYCNTEQKVQLK